MPAHDVAPCVCGLTGFELTTEQSECTNSLSNENTQTWYGFNN